MGRFPEIVTGSAQPVDAWRRTSCASLAVAVVLGLAGCGGAQELAPRERPPAPITMSVSAAITRRSVTVSPSRLRAGTVELIVANLTASARSITLRRARSTGDDGARPEQRIGPIAPGGAASLKADLAPGTYRVSARAATIEPATIEVRPAREGARGQLVQP